MGIFNIFKKNSQNVVLVNMSKLLKRLDETGDFTSVWLNICILTITGLVEGLNSNTNENNDFKKYVNNLNEEKAYKIYKILTQHFLIVFLKNGHNIAFLKRNSINKDDFKKEVFSFFELNNTEISDYNENNECFSGNPSGYFIKLYRKIFSDCYAINLENVIEESLNFANSLSKSQEIFMEELGKIL